MVGLMTIFNLRADVTLKQLIFPLKEPEIFNTTSMFSTVIENMVYNNKTKKLDFDDDSLTANMRALIPCTIFPTRAHQVDLQPI